MTWKSQTFRYNITHTFSYGLKLFIIWHTVFWCFWYCFWNFSTCFLRRDCIKNTYTYLPVAAVAASSDSSSRNVNGRQQFLIVQLLTSVSHFSFVLPTGLYKCLCEPAGDPAIRLSIVDAQSSYRCHTTADCRHFLVCIGTHTTNCET